MLCKDSTYKIISLPTLHQNTSEKFGKIDVISCYNLVKHHGHARIIGELMNRPMVPSLFPSLPYSLLIKQIHKTIVQVLGNQVCSNKSHWCSRYKHNRRVYMSFTVCTTTIEVVSWGLYCEQANIKMTNNCLVCIRTTRLQIAIWWLTLQATAQTSSIVGFIEYNNNKKDVRASKGKKRTNEISMR